MSEEGTMTETASGTDTKPSSGFVPHVELRIPPGVSSHLVQELERIQQQICILLRNHKILRRRRQKNPKDALIPKQIERVEEWLFEFNDKQTPIFDEIRREVAEMKKIDEEKKEKEEIKQEEEIKEEAEESGDNVQKEEPKEEEKDVKDEEKEVNDEKKDISEENDVKDEEKDIKDEEEVVKDEEKDVKGEEKDVKDDEDQQQSTKELMRSPTFEFEVKEEKDNFKQEEQDVKEESPKDVEVEKVEPIKEEASAVEKEIQSSKPLSLAERMAIVREKKRLKTGGGGKSSGKSTPTPSRTPSPAVLEVDDWRSNVVDPDDELKPGQFRGHVASVEKFHFDLTEEEITFVREASPHPRPDAVHAAAPKSAFLLGSGLVGAEKRILNEIEGHREAARTRRNEIRYQTHIPEYCEPRKQRLNYSWLITANGGNGAAAYNLNNLNSPPLLRTRGRRVDAASKRVAETVVAAQDLPRKKRKRRPPVALMGENADVIVDMVGLRSSMATATANTSNSNSRSPTPTPPRQEEDEDEEDDYDETAADGGELIFRPADEMMPEAPPPPVTDSIVVAMEEPNPITASSTSTSIPEVVTTAAPPARSSERRRAGKGSDRFRAKIQKDKEVREEELRQMVQKSEDLKSQIDGNGLTVATRKERMRKTELQTEKEEIDEKIAKLKLILAQYN